MSINRCMLYITQLYMMVSLGGDNFKVKHYQQYELFSSVPIIECTAKAMNKEASGERYIVHICETEKLYYFMTGEKTVKIITEGINRA